MFHYTFVPHQFLHLHPRSIALNFELSHFAFHIFVLAASVSLLNFSLALSVNSFIFLPVFSFTSFKSTSLIVFPSLFNFSWISFFADCKDSLVNVLLMLSPSLFTLSFRSFNVDVKLSHSPRRDRLTADGASSAGIAEARHTHPNNKTQTNEIFILVELRSNNLNQVNTEQFVVDSYVRSPRVSE